MYYSPDRCAPQVSMRMFARAHNKRINYCFVTEKQYTFYLMRIGLPLLLFFFVVMTTSAMKIKLVNAEIDTATAERVDFDVITHSLKSLESEDAYEATRSQNELFLIQFKKISQDNKIAVERVIGHPLREYLPDNAFLVWTTRKRASISSGFDFVSYVGPLLNEYKLAYSLTQLNGLEAVSVTVVLVADDRTELEKSDLLKRLSVLAGRNSSLTLDSNAIVTVKFPLQDASVTLRLIRTLATDSEVKWIERKHPVKTMKFDTLDNFKDLI